jgi:putative addiction module component (TIGR02574 family)
MLAAAKPQAFSERLFLANRTARSSLVHMSPTTEQVYNEALSLTVEARADLTERLVASLAEEISVEVTRSQLDEVHRRIAQVESGEVALIPGDEALARVRRLLGEHAATDE